MFCQGAVQTIIEDNEYPDALSDCFFRLVHSKIRFDNLFTAFLRSEAYFLFGFRRNVRCQNHTSRSCLRRGKLLH